MHSATKNPHAAETMKTIKIHWIHLDNHGTVRCAYRAKNGKLYYPINVGALWIDLRPNVLRNNPGIEQHFDVETAGGVYRIGSNLYVCESCRSKVFKPLSEVMRELEASNPIVGTAPKGCALEKRENIIPVCTVPVAYTV